MDGRYAVIGWGSLLWDLDCLEPNVTGEWQIGAGPNLPLEFTRVSPKRKMGLTVCLDEEHGVPCASHVIASRRTRVEEAQADLAARERAPIARVGAVCLKAGHRAGRGDLPELVADWCRENGWQGAVWTDLLSNWVEMLGGPFSIDAAVAYVSGLRGDSLDEAVTYIRLAPKTTDTPLRRALEDEDWWQREARRLGV